VTKDTVTENEICIL